MPSARYICDTICFARYVRCANVIFNRKIFALAKIHLHFPPRRKSSFAARRLSFGASRSSFRKADHHSRKADHHSREARSSRPFFAFFFAAIDVFIQYTVGMRDAVKRAVIAKSNRKRLPDISRRK